ncbi:MAG: hypothetical protein ACI4NM_04470, partial [Bullifex sp.]
FVAVYGRRRVGKTYLIRSYFQDTFDFWFTGMFNESRDAQLKEFRNTLSAISGRNHQSFADWFEAFSALKEYLLSLNKPQVVVFLDELPWMDTPKSSLYLLFFTFLEHVAFPESETQTFLLRLSHLMDAQYHNRR